MATINISFDAQKSLKNNAERGLPFSLVEWLEWDSALIREDTRRDYGERRFLVLGLIHDRLHAMVFTPREDKVHVISLRKANAREIHHHEQTQNPARHPGH